MANSPTTKTIHKPVMTYASGYTSYFTVYEVWGPLVLVTNPFSDFKSLTAAKKEVTSTSTKPWPLGLPTEWTPHERMWYSRKGGGGSATIRDEIADRKYIRYFVTGAIEPACVPSGGSAWTLHKIPLDPGTAAINAKLRGKLKNDFNAAVALAEVNKSVDLIASTAKRIGLAMLAIKSGKTRRALELLGNPKLKKLSYRDESHIRRQHRTKKQRQVARHWLELQYGWRPLISDVFNAVKLATVQKPPGTCIVRCAETAVVRSDDRFPWGSSPFPVNMTQRYIISGKVGRRVVVEYKIDDVYLNRVANVGLTNPLVVAWELVPFSFVVDWFLPLGEWLNGLDATMGLQFLKGSSTFYYDVEQKVEFESLKNTLGSTVFFWGSQEFAYKKRENMASFPGIERPVVKNPISTVHAANALALLVSAFHK